MQSISKLMCRAIPRACYNHFIKPNSLLLSSMQVRKYKNSKSFKGVNLFSNIEVLTDCIQHRQMSTIVVKHDNQRFFINQNEEVAYLKYSINDGIMHIKSTYVPKKLSGHGLGKILAKTTLEYAVQHGLLLKISCDFVKFYIDHYEPGFIKYVLK